MEKSEKLVLLNSIRNRYLEIENIMLEFDNETLEEFNDFHNQGSSLNHCSRWGLTAVEELIEANN